MLRPPLRPTLFPYTTLFRSSPGKRLDEILSKFASPAITEPGLARPAHEAMESDTKDQRSRSEQAKAAAIVEVELSKIWKLVLGDRKSTRLNSSHLGISYAVF